MPQQAVDMCALLDRQDIVRHVAMDPGGLEHHELVHCDAAANGPGKASALRANRALDRAGFPLHEAGAGYVAFDMAIDVKLCACGDVALHSEIGPEH